MRVLDLERYPHCVRPTLHLLEEAGYITPHRSRNQRGYVLPPEWDLNHVLLLARYGRGLRYDASERS